MLLLSFLLCDSMSTWTHSLALSSLRRLIPSLWSVYSFSHLQSFVSVHVFHFIKLSGWLFIHMFVFHFCLFFYHTFLCYLRKQSKYLFHSIH